MIWRSEAGVERLVFKVVRLYRLLFYPCHRERSSLMSAYESSLRLDLFWPMLGNSDGIAACTEADRDLFSEQPV
jgi:hypothetical protein